MRTPAEEKTISQFEIAQFRNSCLGGSKGVEPSTTAFTVRCSARLSYDPHENCEISNCGIAEFRLINEPPLQNCDLAENGISKSAIRILCGDDETRTRKSTD